MSTETEVKTSTPAPPQVYEIVVDETFTGLVLRLREARNDKRDAEEREAQVKKEIVARMGRATTAVFMRLPILRISHRRRTAVNPDVLREAFPEAYEAAIQTTEYDVITIL